MVCIYFGGKKNFLEKLFRSACKAYSVSKVRSEVYSSESVQILFSSNPIAGTSSTV